MLVPGTSLELKRRESGLTQKEVAERLGISRNTLAAYESGKTEIPLSVFIYLSEIYKCNVFEIFGVHAPHIVFDIPKTELAHAYARYKVGAEKELDKLMRKQKPESYYEMRYKIYYDEIKV